MTPPTHPNRLDAAADGSGARREPRCGRGRLGADEGGEQDCSAEDCR